MTASLQQPWGADGSDPANNAPSGAGWGYLDNMMRGEASNVQPTTRGWESEHAGGMKEVLVAIGGLVTNLTVNFVHDQSGAITAAAAQVLKVAVQTDYGINPGSANLANVWIVAISNDANVANVNLVYDAASQPQYGELVFTSAATDLSLATPATTTFTINSSSTVHGAGALVPRQPGVSPVALGATPFADPGVVIAVN